MLPSAFDTVHVLLLLLAAASGAFAVVAHGRRRTVLALSLLTLAAFVLRLFAITLDPFLNQWDECFHALVAKNLISHPLTPMLHRVAEGPTTTSWAKEHFWLHKPPFFLWQMALSLKVLGIHPWAARVPSALWWTAMVPVVARMGTLLFNARTGFAAAVLCAFAWFPQELIAGAINTDHNDAIFIAAVTCSCWCWLEYQQGRSARWALLTGLFSAGAVLTKWYVGLVIFLPWGITLMLDRFPRKDLRDLLIGFCAVVLIAGGWIAFIATRFPAEAAFQWSFKSLHFSVPVDGHRGPAMYHFNVIAELIPPFTWWIVGPALLWALWRLRSTAHRVFLLSTVVAVHLFFGIAATKMPCYTMVLFPLYLIALAFAITSLTDLIRAERVRPVASGIILAGLAYLMLDLGRTRERHTVQVPYRGDQHWRAQQLRSIEPLERLATIIPDPDRAVVFHVPRLHHIQFMFASGIEAWETMPTPEDVQRLGSAGYTVYALQDGAPAEQFPPGVELIPDSVVRVPTIARL